MREGGGREWCGVIGRGETVVRGREGGGGRGKGEGREGEGHLYMGGRGRWVLCHCCVMVVMVGIVVWCGHGAAVQRWWYWVVVVCSAGPLLV